MSKKRWRPTLTRCCSARDGSRRSIMKDRLRWLGLAAVGFFVIGAYGILKAWAWIARGRRPGIERLPSLGRALLAGFLMTMFLVGLGMAAMSPAWAEPTVQL